MHNTLITCREINCISTSLCNYQDPTTHEMCMHETITFNNWAYNEFVKDCYNTNLLAHFEQLLDKQGFVCDVPLGTPQRLDKPTKERQSKLIQDISNDQFAKFLASDLGTRATDPQFEDIFIAINSLHLHEQNDETLELYKDILTDPYKRHDHKHVIKLLQTDEALSKELAKLKKSTYEFKLLQTTGQKIKVLRQIEATYNIGFLDVTFEDNGAINMEDNLYRTIKLLFKSKRAKPTTKQELKTIYISMIRHIAGNDVIATTRERKAKGKEKERTYKLNLNTLQRHIELSQYKDPGGRDFLPEFHRFLKPELQDMFVN